MKKEIIKSFDLEEYKNGAKVKTRDGNEVRIVCTDVKNQYYPIIALVKLDDGSEASRSYTSEGKFLPYKSGITNDDLVIVEEIKESVLFWSDKEDKDAKGYFIDCFSKIEYNSRTRYNQGNYRYFASRKQAKSAIAMARISQIMANDVEHFGGVITDEEWKDLTVEKYVIHRLNNAISFMCSYLDYHFLAFHTEDQRDLFLEKYHDLVKDYLMIG